MKFLYFLIGLSLFLGHVSFGQSNNYYYYNGEKISLDIDRTVIHIITTSGFTINQLDDLGFGDIDVQDDAQYNTSIIKATFLNEPTVVTYFQKSNLLKSKSHIKR